LRPAKKSVKPEPAVVERYPCYLDKKRKINALEFSKPTLLRYGILKAYAAILQELLPVLHSHGSEPYVDCFCKQVLADTKHAWVVREEHKIWQHARRLQPLFRTPEVEDPQDKEGVECWVLMRLRDYVSQPDEDGFDTEFDFEGYYANIVRGVRIPDPIAVVGDMYYCLLYLKKRMASERSYIHWNNEGDCNCLEYVEREYPEDDWRRRLLRVEKDLARALVRKKIGGFRGVPGDKYMRMEYFESPVVKCGLERLRLEYLTLMRGLDKTEATPIEYPVVVPYRYADDNYVMYYEIGPSYA
jgi:hypothetical protein